MQVITTSGSRPMVGPGSSACPMPTRTSSVALGRRVRSLIQSTSTMTAMAASSKVKAVCAPIDLIVPDRTVATRRPCSPFGRPDSMVVDPASLGDRHNDRPRNRFLASPDPGAGRDHRRRRGARRGLPGRGAPDAVVVVRDASGTLRDLSWVPDTDAEVVPVAANTDEGRSVIRHSAAHVLAQAVQELFPQAKLGIGPPITDGFYYDFDVPEPFTPEDLDKLEKRMRQIVKEGQLFSRRVYESKEQARAELAGEPYKLELVDDKSGDPDIMEVGGDELTAYDNLNPRTRERVWVICAAGRTSRPPATSRPSS